MALQSTGQKSQRTHQQLPVLRPPSSNREFSPIPPPLPADRISALPPQPPLLPQLGESLEEDVENFPPPRVEKMGTESRDTDSGLSSSKGESLSMTSNQLTTSCLQGTSTPAPKRRDSVPEFTPNRSSDLMLSRSVSNLHAVSQVSEPPSLSASQLVSSNPFESALVDSLHGTTFSPSRVFSKVLSPDTAGQTPKGTFRWDIDQQALLNPALIDEIPSQEQSMAEEHGRDPEMEAKIHTAIEHFWARNHQVAPSPLDQPVFRSRLVSHISDSIGKASPKVLRRVRSPNPHPAPVHTSSPRPPNTQHSQTLLTIPPNVDLVNILGSQFMYKEEVLAGNLQAESGDVSNISSESFRRKLFAGDVGEEEEGADVSGVNGSRLLSASDWEDDEVLDGGDMEAFHASSSFFRSDDPNLPPHASPPMSPIARDTDLASPASLMDILSPPKR